MSVALLLLLNVAFILHLVVSARRLPDTVAAHFLPNGVADGWLRRRTYLTIVTAIGPGVSLVWLGLVFFFPNPPLNALMEHIAWAGCLLLAFVFGVHCLTVKANRAPDAKLPMPFFWSFLVVLQLGMVVWAVTWPN